MQLKFINKKLTLPYWIIARKATLTHIFSESILTLLIFKIFDKFAFNVTSHISLNNILFIIILKMYCA